jgi:hypothetical protein
MRRRDEKLGQPYFSTFTKRWEGKTGRLAFLLLWVWVSNGEGVFFVGMM